GANGHGSISSLLSDRAIWIGAEATDWRDAIRRAGDALVASGAVADEYTDEMIATVETLGPYIVIAPGIALAHSRPSPAVRRSGLSIVTLRHPVAFGHRTNDPVRLVVGLAAPDDAGHVDALASLAGFLVDDARREALLAAGDSAAVQSLIRDWERTEEAEASPA
ncbi:MAG TPA: PTS sugar transporter subunit IIA, partial [Candidatus Sulfomarinibacteraceae bacterium]|nr:PTS sugar transporter subunit IIA [Candidatus Sulfomarinibacteraceae bacterium]